MDPEARSAFLDRACQQDVELRREVESLLEHHAAAQGVIGSLVEESLQTFSPGPG